MSVHAAVSEAGQGYWEREADEYHMSLRGGVFLWKDTTDGNDSCTPLANFAAEIRAEIEKDDGTEVRLFFELAIAQPGRARVFIVPAASFHDGTWTKMLAASEVVHPRQQEQLRAAVQLLSTKVTRRRVYSHLGWRLLEGGERVFVHARGAIGAGGVVDGIRVEVSDRLSRYVLPRPPVGEELCLAVTESLRLVDYGPDHITVPVLAATRRAPLGESHQSVFLSGTTDTGKTEFAAIALSHFGAGFDACHMPGNWDEDTENSLEQLAYEAKDTLLVIDEYVPGKAADDRTLRAKVDRVLRGTANGTGRQRMRPDASLIPSRPPQALVLGTGEDVPQGHSLRGRMLVVRVEKGELHDTEKFLRSRGLAADGTYSSAMSGYISWLARQPALTAAQRSAKVLTRRRLFERGAAHRRTPDIAAELLWGWDTFIKFAVEVGAVCPEDEGRWHERGVVALRAGMAVQAAELRDAAPVDRFLAEVGGAVAARRVYFVSKTGGTPDNPAQMGWAPGGLFENQWEAKGQLIGVADGNDIYLSPTVAVGEVKRLCRMEGTTFPLSANALGRQLAERGLLSETGPKGKPTVLKTFASGRTSYWHLKAGVLAVPDPANDEIPELAPA